MCLAASMAVWEWNSAGLNVRNDLETAADVTCLDTKL